jgi:hypothetical protein
MGEEGIAMGRIVAFLLGGLALALYGPYLFMSEAQLNSYVAWWQETIGVGWYDKIFKYGPGLFAGLALLLLAVRGRDGDITDMRR